MSNSMWDLILLAVGGLLASLPGVISTLVQRRREISAAKKLDAEADKIDVDRDVEISKNALEWVGEFRDELFKLRQELSTARAMINSLTNDNIALRSSIEAVQLKNKMLEKTLETLTQSNKRLTEENADLRTQIASMEQQLEDLRKGGTHV